MASVPKTQAQQEIPVSPSYSLCESVGKIVLVALGILVLAGGAIATWQLYGQLGNWSFGILGGSVALGLAFLVGAWWISRSQQTLPEMTPAKIGEILKAHPNATPAQIREAFGGPPSGERDASMVQFSLINTREEYQAVKTETVAWLSQVDEQLTFKDRAIGALMGMAVGDGAGAPYEFSDFKDPKKLSSFKLFDMQWTDDTSMGLCLADMLILGNGQLDGAQLQLSFKDWWYRGYNNATDLDPGTSVGLGGNISMSFEDPLDRDATGRYATKAGNHKTSGNGSLMRLAPVPIVAKDRKEARRLAAEQSSVTHQGLEAAAACELWAEAMFVALHSTGRDSIEIKRDVFAAIAQFLCLVPSVNELAQGGGEWNWKSRLGELQINEKRYAAKPGYFGAYAMDALLLSLHYIYRTDSFESAVRMAAEHGGDSDSVGAITGMLAGAIYGVRKIPKEWLDGVQKHDRGGEIATRAVLLANIRENNLQTPPQQDNIT